MYYIYSTYIASYRAAIHCSQLCFVGTIFLFVLAELSDNLFWCSSINLYYGIFITCRVAADEETTTKDDGVSASANN